MRFVNITLLLLKMGNEECALYQLLIVDDEKELRCGMANLFPFEDFGFEVAALSGDGKEALEIIKTQTIDVVITDIMMSGMDGLTLAQEIHQKKIPVTVIVVSGYTDFSYAQKAIEYNVRKYIVKPVKYADLSDVFSKLRIEFDGRGTSAQNQVVGKEESSAYYSRIIDIVKAFLEENYKDATLEKAAACVHLNMYYLSNVFRLTTGEKFSDYLTRVKMIKSAELLADRNYKIHSIGSHVGYTNSNNFARAFKAYYKMTPSEYRERSFDKCEGNNDA